MIKINHLFHSAEKLAQDPQNRYSRSIGKAINECSIYQTPLRESKGDFKGKLFPLDYLVIQ